MSAYTAAERKAYGRKMAKVRAGIGPMRRTRTVSGYGAYKIKYNARQRNKDAEALTVAKNTTPIQANNNGGWWPGLGSTLGSAAGGFFGGPAGASVGSQLGGWLGKITGLGSYRLKRNTILQPDPPVVSNTTSGVRIKHREYINDIQSSILFNNQFALPVQPGLYDSFPWLSGLAANFTQYKFHGLLYEFVTTSGSAVSSTNNSLGEVMMATNYNSGDATFANKQQMLNEEFASSGVPSANLIHAIECAPSQTPVDKLYTRTGSVPTGQDVRLYDLGLFQFAVQGQQVGTGQGGSTSITLGELYCTYDVEFFKPQLDDYTGLTTLGSHFVASGTTQASSPIGTTPVINFDNIGITFNVGTGTVVTMPAGYLGKWMMTCQWIGNATSTLVPPAMTYTNATIIKLANADTGARFIGSDWRH